VRWAGPQKRKRPRPGRTSCGRSNDSSRGPSMSLRCPMRPRQAVSAHWAPDEGPAGPGARPL
jgi:hypothetical protein